MGPQTSPFTPTIRKEFRNINCWILTSGGPSSRGKLGIPFLVTSCNFDPTSWLALKIDRSTATAVTDRCASQGYSMQKSGLLDEELGFVRWKIFPVGFSSRPSSQREEPQDLSGSLTVAIDFFVKNKSSNGKLCWTKNRGAFLKALLAHHQVFFDEVLCFGQGFWVV